MSKMVASSLDKGIGQGISLRDFFEENLMDPLTRLGHYVQYGIKHSGEGTLLVIGNTKSSECYYYDTIGE